MELFSKALPGFIYLFPTIYHLVGQVVARGKTDEKGRIVIPKEVRQDHDEFLIFGSPSGILLKPIEKIEDPLSDLEEVAVDTDETVLEIKRRIREALGKGVVKDVRRH